MFVHGLRTLNNYKYNKFGCALRFLAVSPLTLLACMHPSEGLKSTISMQTANRLGVKHINRGFGFAVRLNSRPFMLYPRYVSVILRVEVIWLIVEHSCSRAVCAIEAFDLSDCTHTDLFN